MTDTWLAPLATPERMQTIAGYDLFDPVLRGRLNELSRRTSSMLGMPAGMVSIVLDTAQFYAGSHGLTGWIAAAEGTPVEWAFCAHAVLSGGRTYVVPDATVHPRHRDNPLVMYEGTRAYAGVALVGPDEQVLGMHCVVGSRPREFTEEQLAVLSAGADEVMAVLSGYQVKTRPPFRETA